MGGENCTVLRLRLMHKLAMSHTGYSIIDLDKKFTLEFLIFLNSDLHQVSDKLWSPVLFQYYGSTLHTSYIRKEKYRPATTPAAAAAAAPMYVTLRGPNLNSEMGWTRELWSKTNLLNWQN